MMSDQNSIFMMVPLRYSDLAHAIPGISQRMLTLTLKQLQRSGLVIRTAHAEVPPRVEYSLADLGTSLLSTVLELAAWSAGRHAEIRRHQNAYDTQHPTGHAAGLSRRVPARTGPRPP
jgi:DNA-binding HxlR family transcriptional regulator